MTRRLAAWSATILVALAARSAAADDSPRADDREILAWFDSTGLPDGLGRPWVHAVTGKTAPREELWVERKGEKEPPNVPEILSGPLLTETPESFTVLGRNLLPRTIPRTKADWEPADAAPRGFSAASFTADAGDYLASLAAGTATPAGSWPEDFEVHLGLRGETLGWARYAGATGDPALAGRLLDAARRIPDAKGRTDRTLLDVAAEELATPVFGRIVVDFGHPEESRAALRDRLRRFVAAFSTSEHAERARSMLATLETMVAEDDAHANSPREFDTLTRDEQIAELIFLLRDQNGAQHMQPGSPSIWSDPRGKQSPAERLAAYGLDAVPALIPEIEDRRWTRTVGYWRQFMFSHYVLTVGDAALRILERIAGRSFWRLTYTAASMAKDGQAAETRKVVEAWWKEREEKGEAQQLIDVLAAGSEGASRALRRLQKNYPGLVADAVVKAWGSLKDPRERFYVIQELGDVDDPRVIELLLKETRDGPSLECRVRAAWNVVSKGHPEVRETMLREWKRLLESPPWTSFDLGFGFGALVHFLCGVGGPEGVRAVAAALPGLTTEMVHDILELRGAVERGFDPVSAAALEDLLAGALDDDSDTGFSSTWAGGSVDHERVCDCAAQELCRLRGETAAFDLGGTEGARDRQIAALRAAWRSRRGLPPAAPPGRASTNAGSTFVGSTEGRGAPPEILARLRGMEGKPLDPTGVRDLVRDAVQSAPKGRVLVRLLARWQPDGQGFGLRLEIRPLLGDLDGEGTWFAAVSARGSTGLPAGAREEDPGAPRESSLVSVRQILDAILASPPDRAVVLEAAFSRHPAGH